MPEPDTAVLVKQVREALTYLLDTPRYEDACAALETLVERLDAATSDDFTLVPKVEYLALRERLEVVARERDELARGLWGSSALMVVALKHRSETAQDRIEELSQQLRGEAQSAAIQAQRSQAAEAEVKRLREAKEEAEGIIHSAIVTRSDPVEALHAAMNALGGDSAPVARAALQPPYDDVPGAGQPTCG